MCNEYLITLKSNERIIRIIEVRPLFLLSLLCFSPPLISRYLRLPNPLPTSNMSSSSTEHFLSTRAMCGFQATIKPHRFSSSIPSEGQIKGICCTEPASLTIWAHAPLQQVSISPTVNAFHLTGRSPIMMVTELAVLIRGVK